MRRLQLFLAFTLLASHFSYAQTATPRAAQETEAATVERNALFFELRALDAEASELRRPLARSRAKVEIANAAWELDREWAKKLLREAYELTFPEEEERDSLRRQAVGEGVRPPTELEWARTQMRDRVFAVAGRDRAFADELNLLGANELGRAEEEQRDRSLASKALGAGDAELASQYVSLAINADPTRGAASELIPNVAKLDRAAADKLIIEYIERLRATPVSMSNGSALRVYFFLRNMMGGGYPGRDGRPVPTPGPAVMRAYVSYVVESMTALSRSEPESLKTLRPFLLSAWAPLQRHAPELTAAFVALERLSRRPGEEGGLPKPVNDAEERKARTEEQVRQALKSGQPDDEVIGLAMGRKDFADARKMIDLLSDVEKKTRFLEWVNVEEALSLAAGDDQAGAERLALLLNKTESVLRVYTVLMGRCAKHKDDLRVMSLADQAARQLRHLHDSSSLASGLSGLAEAVAPVNEGLAFEILDEAVASANSNNLEEAVLGRLVIETGVFKTLAAKNEPRALQSAHALKERSARIAALATIYQRSAKALTKGGAHIPSS
jgi:hypothetical protein